ncbi:MAG: TIGR03067 domain-containing protein [Bacteroidetes bacterium]|nr:TIGR03067 domain-containing protein [Bacteroidota bacterium]
MRLFFSALFALLIISCKSTKVTSAISSQLNGTWIPIKQQMSGKDMPIAFYEKQKLIISDSSYTLIAESVDKGIIRVNEDKIDIIGKEGVNSGRQFKAIFKIENNQLIICYNLKGDSYPDSFETQGKILHFLSIFRKE